MSPFEAWQRFHIGATADDYAAAHPYTFTYPSHAGPYVERFENARLLLHYCTGWSKRDLAALFVAGPTDVRSA